MRAWQVGELGEPGAVMRLAEVEQPSPGAGQLLVRVRAAAVNFPDALMCRGHYQVRPPLPFTPGVELCGEVVGGERSGERVIGTPLLPAGAFAEYALMDARTAFAAPAALDDAEAAAMHIAYQTAWFALHRRAALRAGETLLVHAAAGGVGSAAVQLGKAAGATVIGVVGGPEKAVAARELGADVVIDRRSEDFVTVVKEVTGGRGADVVFDPVGGDAYTGSARCVAFEGRIVVVGFASGTIPTPGLNHALVKNYSVLGLHWGLYGVREPAAVLAAHAELTALAGKGVVRPLVSERLPLEGAADGVQRVADGTTTGRVVVLP
ncbi:MULTISPECIES: NADPH:quinone oxidoreductase family protein [unclassified Kitasatospora]|uniref:NADPH:quinone oxidoreductase family protein n=1 Tax=unclassified Kitasatospora TaxID=2633591 RepID=UPI00070C8B58|nr:MULTISPECIES: NADPH:quinone oxidoreductase family protein [unclassified Kitasatospora]KQV21886.1 alcohol dehydrogenase [Kitasatospora sp. Root107]KRB75692.1 alcohol dehydrogenase [Kitasatospora sp. Root187]